MEQIKDCPFCGRKTPDDLEDTLYPSGGYWRETDGMRHYVSHRERKPGDSQCWTMHCGVGGWRCGAQITADTREEAIAAWNRRAAIQQAAGAVPEGEIVVTKTDFGAIVAVTRQDSEGRILEVIAQDTQSGSSDHSVPCAGGRVQAWQPIETAPKETMVLVYTPPQDGDWPDSVRISFDHIPEDSDCWHDHYEHYEHYMMVGGPNAAGPDVVCTGPAEKAPYTHWMPIPPPPRPDAPTVQINQPDHATGVTKGGSNGLD